MGKSVPVSIVPTPFSMAPAFGTSFSQLFKGAKYPRELASMKVITWSSCIVLFLVCSSSLHAEEVALNQEQQSQIEGALRDLKAQEASARASAATTLAAIGAKEHAKDIAVLLTDKDPWVIYAALQALARLEAKTYEKDISRLLKHGDPFVRLGAVYALGALKATAHTKDIAALLEDPGVFQSWTMTMPVKAAAAQTLGQFQAREYAGQIAELLKDKDPQVKGYAIQTLVELDAKEYQKGIGLLLQDKDEGVRDLAKEALTDWETMKEEVKKMRSESGGPL